MGRVMRGEKPGAAMSGAAWVRLIESIQRSLAIETQGCEVETA